MTGQGVTWSLDVEEDARRHGRRSVTWHGDDDGSLVLTVSLGPEDGAVVAGAVEATGALLRADQARAPPLEELPDPDLGLCQNPPDLPAGTLARRGLADALVTIFVEAGESSADGSGQVPNPIRRAGLIVPANLADLTEVPQTPQTPRGPNPWSPDRGQPTLLRQTAGRLACDARIIVEADGPADETVDLGRAMRFPTSR